MQSNSPYKLIFKQLKTSLNAEKVFEHLYSNSTDTFWLDSSRVIDGYSRFSFMGECGIGKEDFSLTYQTHQLSVSKTQKEKTEQVQSPIFDYINQVMREHSVEDVELPFKFRGGLVGYLGYELKRETVNVPVYQSPLPDAIFLFITRFLAFDHLNGHVYLVALTDKSDFSAAELWLSETIDKLEEIKKLPESETLISNEKQDPIQFCIERGYHQYLDDIAICKQKILDGESYEVCLTTQINADVEVNDWDLYKMLRKVNPAPYAAYFRFEEFSILSSSPEQFLDIQAERWVYSKPIKGTVKRSENEAEDELIKESLRNSEKDHAENLMIVDLLRNDLGKVCEIGSVSVPLMMEVESYATVHQLVSTVKGRLKEEISPVDCVKSVFPGGSITGAPKIRTMEIIDQLEWEARGVYTGSIGYFSLNETAEFNIAIRTLIHQNNKISFGVGGAIIELSDPDAEFREILVKAFPMIKAVVKAIKPNAQPDDFLIDDMTGEEFLALTRR